MVWATRWLRVVSALSEIAAAIGVAFAAGHGEMAGNIDLSISGKDRARAWRRAGYFAGVAFSPVVFFEARRGFSLPLSLLVALVLAIAIVLGVCGLTALAVGPVAARLKWPRPVADGIAHALALAGVTIAAAYLGADWFWWRVGAALAAGALFGWLYWFLAGRPRAR